MEQEIQKILKNRIRGSLIGIGIVMLIGAIVFGKLDNKLTLSIIVISIVSLFIFVLMVNNYNYPNPNKYYRTFNKIFYIWLSRLLIIGSIINILSGIKNYNPLNSTSPSLNDTLAGIGADVGAIAIARKQLSTGKFVELYFKQKELDVNKVNLI